MDKEEAQKYLQECAKQRPNWNIEYPKGFDYKKENADFLKFVKQLELLIKEQVRYDSGSSIQDASFHSEAFLPDKCLVLPDKRDKDGYKRGAGISFSNFGRLVTIYEEENIKPEVLKTILELLASSEYVYIPRRFLDEEYPVLSSRGKEMKQKWGDLFFNYS